MKERGIDFLFPPTCVTCEAPVMQGDSLCADCFKQLEPIIAPFCPQCGAPFAASIEALNVCTSCLISQPNWQEGRAGLVYNPFARDLILRLKYSGQDRFAPIFAKFMVSAAASSLKSTDFVVPVPLHLKRLRKRGYNQSVLLGRAFSQLTRLPFFPDFLERYRETESLGKMSPLERRRCLENSIRVRPKYRSQSFVGRRAILIDDVMTSGATAEVCSKALLATSCASVMTVVAIRGRLNKVSFF